MARNEGFRRYFEAAAVLGEITRARAEDLVREMMGSGDAQRAQAQQWVDELVERSRKAAEDMLDLVRSEVSSQLHALGLDPDELARQAADIMRRSAAAGKRVMKDAASGAGKGARHDKGVRHEPAAANAPTVTHEGGARKPAGAKKAGATKKAGTTKKAGGAKKAASAKKAGATKKAGGAKKVAGAKKAGATKKAGGAKKAAKKAAKGSAAS